MGSASKTERLKLPQWLGNEYFERTDMNDAFKAIDEGYGTMSQNIDAAKTELSGSIDAAKSAAASDLAAAKTELSGSIDAAKSAAASDLAAAKTELSSSIDAAKAEVYKEFDSHWSLLCEGGGYSYTCTFEEGTTGTKGKTSTYCVETLTGTAAWIESNPNSPTGATKTTEVYDPDDGVVDYVTVVELYTLAVNDTTMRWAYTLTVDANGAWSGVWS